MARTIRLTIAIGFGAALLIVAALWGPAVFMNLHHPGPCGYRARTLSDVSSPDGRTRVLVSCRIPILALPDWVDPPLILHVKWVSTAAGSPLFDGEYSISESSDVADLAVEWPEGGEAPVLVGIRERPGQGAIVVAPNAPGG